MTIEELKEFYGNKKVLQNINAKINKGEIVGIILAYPHPDSFRGRGYGLFPDSAYGSQPF